MMNKISPSPLEIDARGLHFLPQEAPLTSAYELRDRSLYALADLCDSWPTVRRPFFESLLWVYVGWLLGRHIFYHIPILTTS